VCYGTTGIVQRELPPCDVDLDDTLVSKYHIGENKGQDIEPGHVYTDHKRFLFVRYRFCLLK
jgi:hypothetical protein